MLTKASKRSPHFTEKGTPPSVQCVEGETKFTELIAQNSFLRPKGLSRVFKTKPTHHDIRVTELRIKTPQTA